MVKIQSFNETRFNSSMEGVNPYTSVNGEIR